MKKVIGTVLLTAVFAVIALGVVALMTPTTEAVGCPPPSGPVRGQFCGGIAGIECPGKKICIDDPRDNCCPQLGGADCSGICVRP